MLTCLSAFSRSDHNHAADDFPSAQAVGATADLAAQLAVLLASARCKLQLASFQIGSKVALAIFAEPEFD